MYDYFTQERPMYDQLISNLTYQASRQFLARASHKHQAQFEKDCQGKQGRNGRSRCFIRKTQAAKDVTATFIGIGIVIES
jgi:hypothetical protein